MRSPGPSRTWPVACATSVGVERADARASTRAGGHAQLEVSWAGQPPRPATIPGLARRAARRRRGVERARRRRSARRRDLVRRTRPGPRRPAPAAAADRGRRRSPAAAHAPRPRQPTGVLRLRPLRPAERDPGVGTTATSTSSSYTVFDTETTAWTRPGRPDRLGRRRAGGQRAGAAPGDVRAAGRPAAAGAGQLDRRARHHVGDARGPADDRRRAARVRPLRRGHRSGRSQRRLRHAVPQARGGTDRRAVHSAGPGHAAARRGAAPRPRGALARGDRGTPRCGACWAGTPRSATPW